VCLKSKVKATDPEHEDFETIVQDVYLGTIPYMTSGTFVLMVLNVLLFQLHRSPGVFFDSLFMLMEQNYILPVIPLKDLG
jgi:DNA-directed RNA polymerase subunit beta